MRILGIDPGSRVTGYGVVERVTAGGDGAGAGVRGLASSLRHVAHGTLRPPAGASLAERLGFLHRGLAEVVQRFEPERAVVEAAFVAVSPRAALVLGHSRGALLAALAGAGLPVAELAASEVKKAVVGHGGAAKVQVQTMVTRLLGLESHPPRDAADALAAAVCLAHAGALAGLAGRRRRGGGRRRVRVAVRGAP